MIKLMVCADERVGREECVRRGWLRIAANRFVGDLCDVRVVRRFTDFSLVPGLVMVRGPDFGENPEAAKFEQFVSQGYARWE